MVTSTSKLLDPKTALSVLATYEKPDGLSLKELIDKSTGLTFNDLLLLPGHIDFRSDEVGLESRITRNTTIKTPLLSSPMDTVTETEMAVAMAVGHLSFLLVYVLLDKRRG